MKACVECKHSDNTQRGWQCFRPEFPKDFVSGITHGEPCETERKLTGASRCGPEGKLFEPTLGARLIHLFTREEF